MGTKTIKIHCSKCNEFLYKYNKGGNGSLVKCFLHKILKDNTNGNKLCPKCGQEFARDRIIRNKPAHKIIKGKVSIKGHMKQ